MVAFTTKTSITVSDFIITMFYGNEIHVESSSFISSTKVSERVAKEFLKMICFNNILILYYLKMDKLPVTIKLFTTT